MSERRRNSGHKATMEAVSGRGASSLATQSDIHDNNNQCAQCAESGKEISAAGFCLTCNDFLCEECINQHKTLRGLKSHDLLEVKDVPLQTDFVSMAEPCAVHHGRPIEMYCQDEDILGCSLCFKFGHKTCKNVAAISVLSRGVESSSEYIDFQKAATRYTLVEEHYKEAIQKSLFLTEECHSKTLDDFQTFRSNILSMLETMGEKVKEEAEKLKRENETILKHLEEHLKSHSEEMKSVMTKMNTIQTFKQTELVFVALKKHGRFVIRSLQTLEKLHVEISIKEFQFKSNQTIPDSMKESSIVTVQSTPFPIMEIEEDDTAQSSLLPATQCTSSSIVDIKQHDDGNTSWATGMLELSPTQLILADWCNKCLKLFDLTSNIIIKRLSLTSKPWCVAKLPQCRVAVTIPDSKEIQLFTADQNLDPCGKIDVEGECYGLHSAAERLVVSIIKPEPQVQIIDLQGNVLQKVLSNPSGKPNFATPGYVLFSQNNKLIYVSDSSYNTLTCMTTSGVVQWTYIDKQLNYPRGIAAGDGGCVYICGKGTNAIHVVSHDGGKLAVIPQSQSGLKEPLAVCYNHQKQVLYVSNDSSDAKHMHHITKLTLTK